MCRLKLVEVDFFLKLETPPFGVCDSRNFDYRSMIMY